MKQQTILASASGDSSLRHVRTTTRGRRILLIAFMVSIGIHLVGALLIGVFHRTPPKDDRQAEQGTIELVMEEHKGAVPVIAGEPKPDQSPAPAAPASDPPKPEDPKTERSSPLSIPLPVDRAGAEALPPPLPPPPLPSPPSAQVEHAQSTVSSLDAPAVKEQLRKASPPPSQAAPTFNFRAAESEYDAVVLGSGVIPATLDNKFRNRPPVYSFEEAARGEHGRIVLVAHVGPNGLVKSIDVVEGTGFAGLDRSAVAAVQKWRFLPAMKDGQGVPFDFSCEFVFGSS